MSLQDAVAAGASMVAVDTETLAETRAFNEQVERLMNSLTPAWEVAPEVTRQARREGRGAFPPPVWLPQARDITIPARGGDLRLRVLSPATGAPSGVYLHLHGGGWTFGAADMQDPALWSLVEATGMAAVSVDYRLAPEHPFPAGPDDCEDAALWLLDRGARELGAPERFTIGGESAGGHLAALTLLRLRDRHGVTGAFAGANLVYGAFDLSMTPSTRTWGDRNLVLSLPVMHWFNGNFLPGRSREDCRDPEISPLYASLDGMPPAIFTIGQLDPLLDDSLFMEARWRMAGARTELRVWPEAVHGFTLFPLRVAAAAEAAVFDFLRSV